MPRTKKEAPKPLVKSFPAKTPPDVAKDLTLLRDDDARLAAIDAQFARDGETYDEVIIAAKTAAAITATGALLMELARFFAWVHARNEGIPGGFTAFVSRNGFDIRAAQKFVQVHRRFTANERRHSLAASIGSTKVIELMTLDDEALDAIADGGQAAIDEIDRMSVRQLRAAVRSNKATIEAKDKVVAKKDERIASLHKEIEKLRSDERGQAAKLLEKIKSDEAGFAASVTGIAESINSLMDLFRGENPPEIVRGVMLGLLTQLTQMAEQVQQLADQLLSDAK